MSQHERQVAALQHATQSHQVAQDITAWMMEPNERKQELQRINAAMKAAHYQERVN